MNNAPVVCRDLHKGFPSGDVRIEVLVGLDLEVAAGEMVAIVGESGVGKSTLLHLLAGLDIPDHGEITIAGQALSRMDARQRSVFRNRGIGLVFQFHHLLPEFTALENVVMPRWIQGGNRSAGRSSAIDLLNRFGLGTRLDHHPAHLSGGEQQRVAIARSLINSPMLLLADEPTGNLDTRTAETVFGWLRSLNRREGLTVILATHNPRFAGICDRILQLREGRLFPEEPGNGGTNPDLGVFKVNAALE